MYMLRPFLVYPELSLYCRWFSSHYWEKMVLAQGGSDGPKGSCLMQIDHSVNQSSASHLHFSGQTLDFLLEPFILLS